jgi:hypothetical protein
MSQDTSGPPPLRGPGPMLFGMPAGVGRWAFVLAGMSIVALTLVTEPKLA